MPPSLEDRLLDILSSITAIEKMILDKSLEQFTSDIMLRMATERFLEIVCEASRRLPDNVKEGEPGIEWRKMIDFGNRLRHAYHATNVDIVWGIVHSELPALKSFTERELSKLQPGKS